MLSCFFILMTMNCSLRFNPLSKIFSTETVVLKVVTDILAALDRGHISLLGMFDFSAAFDTVDHSILLRRLEISFGIQGAALSRLVFVILDWESQQVSVNNVLAMSVFLDYGVPQGSVLGPVLFLLYSTYDFVESVCSFGLLAHASSINSRERPRFRSMLFQYEFSRSTGLVW